MRVITTAAPTVREAARRYGRRYRAQVAAHLEFVRTWVSRLGRRWPRFVRAVTPLQRAAKLQTSEAWQYFAGLVAGSRLPAAELFAVNCYDLLDNASLGQGRCTDVAYRTTRQAWLAHNEDWGSDWWPHAILLTVRTPRVQFSASTYYGEVPGYACGGNRHGLAYSCNAISLRHDGYGLPLPFVLFYCNLARSAELALQRLRHLPHGSSVHVNLLDRRAAVSAELRSNGESYLRRQTRGYLVHANHCLADGPFAGADRYRRTFLRYSVDRHRRAQQLVSRHRVREAEVAAEQVLTDTQGRSKIYNSRTLARCTFDLLHKRMTFYDRNGQVIFLPFSST